MVAHAPAIDILLDPSLASANDEYIANLPAVPGEPEVISYNMFEFQLRAKSRLSSLETESEERLIPTVGERPLGTVLTIDLANQRDRKPIGIKKPAPAAAILVTLGNQSDAIGPR